MELLQLKYFYESAKTESFAATAQKFMVPASSVSASVKRLETELGTELFDRTSNRIVLNEKGNTFAKALMEVLEKLDQAVINVSEKQVQNQQIHILIRARRSWVSKLVIEYMEQFPNTQFQMAYSQNIEHLNEFDIIIDEASDKYAEMRRFLLTVEPLCIKAAKNSPLVGKELVFSQLRDQPFIMPQENSNMSLLLEATAKRHGFAPNMAVVSSDRQCRVMCVEAGMGLTLGSRRALQEEMEENITALNVTDFDEAQSIYVYHRHPESNHLVLKNFLAYLKNNRHI